MKKISLCLSAIFILSYCVGYGQPSKASDYVAVKKGEEVPDFPLSLTEPSGKRINRFSDLRGKWVLFDFWGLNCAPCIKALPKLKTLQDKFADDFQVVLVNGASRHFLDSVAKRRLSRSLLYKLPDLAQVTSDSVLGYLFPFNTIPHYVWIQPDGRFYTSTGDQDVTEENLRLLIKFKEAEMYEKKDIVDYAKEKPLFPQLLQRQENSLLYYSGITKWIEGLNDAVDLISDTVNNTIRISRPPLDLLMLITDAITRHRVFTSPYRSAKFDYGKRVILSVRDSNKYFFNPSVFKRIEDWKEKYNYGYEGVFSLDQKDKIYDLMLSDLCRFFQLEAYFEKRKLPSIAIVRTSKEDKLKFRVDRDRSNGTIYTDTAGMFHLYGSAMRIFRERLSAANVSKDFIFVDQTGYEGRIDLEFKSSLSDIPALRVELQKKYDLDLVETEAEVEVLVIKEK